MEKREERKLKEYMIVDYEKASNCGYYWGLFYLFISVLILILLFALVTSSKDLSKSNLKIHAVSDLIMSVFLTAISSFATLYLSQHWIESSAKKCFMIIVVTSLCSISMNFCLFVRMALDYIIDLVVVCLLLAILEALLALFTNYRIYIVVVNKSKFMITYKKGEVPLKMEELTLKQPSALNEGNKDENAIPLLFKEEKSGRDNKQKAEEMQVSSVNAAARKENPINASTIVEIPEATQELDMEIAERSGKKRALPEDRSLPKELQTNKNEDAKNEIKVKAAVSVVAKDLKAEEKKVEVINLEDEIDERSGKKQKIIETPNLEPKAEEKKAEAPVPQEEKKKIVEVKTDTKADSHAEEKKEEYENKDEEINECSGKRQKKEEPESVIPIPETKKSEIVNLEKIYEVKEENKPTELAKLESKPEPMNNEEEEINERGGKKPKTEEPEKDVLENKKLENADSEKIINEKEGKQQAKEELAKIEQNPEQKEPINKEEEEINERGGKKPKPEEPINNEEEEVNERGGKKPKAEEAAKIESTVEEKKGEVVKIEEGINESSNKVQKPEDSSANTKEQQVEEKKNENSAQVENKIEPSGKTEEAIKPNVAEENKDKIKEEGKKEEKKSAMSKLLFLKGVLNVGKKIIASKQLESVQDHRKVNENGKVVWKEVHAIFAIDCSGNIYSIKKIGSMMGSRWNSVKKDYNRCLSQLQKMKDILVTTITFDENVNVYGKYKSPAQALKEANKLPFTGGETNYPKALDAIITCMEELDNKYKEYCICLLFLSDGQGGYPEQGISKIMELKKAGRKIVFYTIALMTEEDDDMKKMVTIVGGEHYKIESQEGATEVFTKILGI